MITFKYIPDKDSVLGHCRIAGRTSILNPELAPALTPRVLSPKYLDSRV